MFPLGSEQSDENLGASITACFFSTMIRQLAVESLKRLFTSFFHEAFFHKSVSHVG